MEEVIISEYFSRWEQIPFATFPSKLVAPAIFFPFWSSVLFTAYYQTGASPSLLSTADYDLTQETGTQKESVFSFSKMVLNWLQALWRSSFTRTVSIRWPYCSSMKAAEFTISCCSSSWKSRQEDNSRWYKRQICSGPKQKEFHWGSEPLDTSQERKSSSPGILRDSTFYHVWDKPTNTKLIVIPSHPISFPDNLFACLSLNFSFSEFHLQTLLVILF